MEVTNTGLVTWTPNSTQHRLQEFTIKVTDGKGGEALQRVSVVVGANLPNTDLTVPVTGIPIIPGLVTAAGIVTAALMSGARQRLKAQGVLWEGEMISQSLPYVPKAKLARLESTGSTVVKGNWAIVSYSFIPDLSTGVSLGVSTTEVQVTAKPQNTDALPSVWDLVGIYLGAKFKIKFPLPDSKQFKLSYEDPGFFMGWGIGKEKPGGTKSSFDVSFSLGIDQGLSIPINPSAYSKAQFPYLPE